LQAPQGLHGFFAAQGLQLAAISTWAGLATARTFNNTATMPTPIAIEIAVVNYKRRFSFGILFLRTRTNLDQPIK
jgi:hypothetical protein